MNAILTRVLRESLCGTCKKGHSGRLRSDDDDGHPACNHAPLDLINKHREEFKDHTGEHYYIESCRGDFYEQGNAL